MTFFAWHRCRGTRYTRLKGAQTVREGQYERSERTRRDVPYIPVDQYVPKYNIIIHVFFMISVNIVVETVSLLSHQTNHGNRLHVRIEVRIDFCTSFFAHNTIFWNRTLFRIGSMNSFFFGGGRGSYNQSLWTSSRTAKHCDSVCRGTILERVRITVRVTRNGDIEIL